MRFQVCSPKELVVGLLELVEEAGPDVVAETIALLLTPLQTGEELFPLDCALPRVPGIPCVLRIPGIVSTCGNEFTQSVEK